MSEKPALFKQRSSKPKPSQRARIDASGEPVSSQDVQEEDTSALATKIKSKAKRVKPKTQLSFGGGDEEEGSEEVFQLKKSSLSQKLSFGKNAASPSPLISQTPVAAGSRPTYDQAYLNELKASTSTAKKPPSGDSIQDLVDSSSMDVDEPSASAIPSEHSIKNAKEKRERLRAQGGQDDFISLTVSRRVEDDGPHPESRLVREEDDIGEGDDEFAEFTSAKERIALGKKSRKVEAKNRRDAMKEMIDDAEEPDPEAMEWEQEQLRRGGHSAESLQPEKKVYVAATIPPTTPLPTLSGAIDRLSQALTALTTSHASHSSSIVTLAEDRSQVDSRENELRKMVEQAEAKRSWFAAYREWVESLAIFLDEKFPQLERFEEEHLALLRERADIISKRRRENDSDDLEAIFGALPEIAENGAEQLDEFGRARVQPTSATRRADRLARRAKRQTALKTSDEEGYSTDASLPSSDDIAYRNAADGFSVKRQEVLSDVRAAEFRDPTNEKGLVGWWGTWREKWTDSYVGAWGGLGLVGAWEFWVRLEIVGWDCIENATSLDTFEWYQGLYHYSRPKYQGGDLGPDGDLTSAMISTAIIPRVCKLVENGALDVYSEKAIRRMVDLSEEISASVEDGNIKVQMLMQAVKTCFATTVTSASETAKAFADHAKTGPALGFNPEAIPARLRIIARNTKLLQNILRWRKYTGEVFGIGEICTTTVRTCIKVAEGGLQVGGLDALQKVHSILPRELVPYEMNAYISM